MANLVIKPALLGHVDLNASVPQPLLFLLFIVISWAKWCQRDLELLCAAPSMMYISIVYSVDHCPFVYAKASAFSLLQVRINPQKEAQS